MHTYLKVLLIILIVVIAIILINGHGADRTDGGAPADDLVVAAMDLQPKDFYDALTQGARVDDINRDLIVQSVVANTANPKASEKDLHSAKLILTMLNIYLTDPKLIGSKGSVLPTLTTPTVRTTIPITSSPAYAERQESAACGRHSLNNLLGGRFFVKNSGLNVTLPPGQLRKDSFGVPISLQSLCRYLNHQMLRASGKGIDCPNDENYDINVLRAALNMLGFESEQSTLLTLREALIEPRIIGFIANYGAGHWVTIQKMPRLRDSIYRYINSVRELKGPYAASGATVREYTSLNEYLKEYGSSIVQILVVRSTNNDFINPVAPIISVIATASVEEQSAARGEQIKQATITRMDAIIFKIPATPANANLRAYLNKIKSQALVDDAKILDTLEKLTGGSDGIARCLIKNKDHILQKVSGYRGEIGWKFKNVNALITNLINICAP